MRSMRGVILLAILSIVALWWGGQNTFIGIRDHKQRVISCADYVKQRPDDRWLKLTDCDYDFDHLAYEKTTSGKIRAVYLPLRPAGVEGGPTQIVVKRDDSEMLVVVEAIEHNDANPQPASDHVLAQLKEPAEGLVEFGLDLKDKDKKELGQLNLGLASDFVIIDYKHEPKLLFGLLALVAGLGMAGYVVLRLVRRARPSPPPPTATAPRDPSNPVSAFERPL